MMQAKKLRTMVFKGGVIIFAANILSSLLGYVRDMLIARNFGASYATDAWYIAANIPELLFRFLLLGALGATFLPVFIEYLNKKEEKEAWQIASSVINISAIFLTVAVAIGMVFAPQLVKLFAPGFDAKTHLLAATLTRIVLPLLIVIAITGLLGAIFHAYFKYLLPSFVPLINVVIVILSIVFFSHALGIFSIAWGTVIGYSISFLFLASFMLIHKRPYTFRINLKHPAMKQILFLMMPLIGAEIVGKGIGVVDRMFVSYLVKGAVTTFNLAYRIVALPITFFSTTVAIAIFPLLSRYAGQADKKDFSETLIFSLKMSLLIIVPCIAGLLVLGKPVIQMLFEHGKFDARDTELTLRALTFLCPALFAFSLRPILFRACYALKKNWLLFRYELIGFFANIVLNAILIRYLGISGIALATTIVVSVMAVYLLAKLKRELDVRAVPNLKSFMYKIFFSSLIVGCVSFLLFDFLRSTVVVAKISMFVIMFVTIILSGLVYFSLLRVFRLEELSRLWQTMKNAITKKEKS